MNYREILTRQNLRKVQKLLKQGAFETLWSGVRRKVFAPRREEERAYPLAYLAGSGPDAMRGEAALNQGQAEGAGEAALNQGQAEGAGETALNQGQAEGAEETALNRGQAGDAEPVVDLIVPIYNGLNLLRELLPGVERTLVPYRLILIDDQSPDPQVMLFLEDYCDVHPEASVLVNEENLGFVRTVNRGLKEATRHVVILNTDVQLPDGWLERLMRPIWENPKVASVTPFTNSGVIMSFPHELEDNDVFNHLPVNQIDEAFRSIKPANTPLPTGVGFCMAMSRAALDAVGGFDEDHFGKGYGEENDWCMRAAKAGFIHVAAENLYVFHNHGGSFLPEEKRRLIAEHSETLAKLHPSYAAKVGDFNQKDPLDAFRAQALASLAFLAASERIFVVHNQLGGGSEGHLQKEAAIWQAQDALIMLLQYAPAKNSYLISFSWKGERAVFEEKDLEKIAGLFAFAKPTRIYVNQTASYPDVPALLKLLTEEAKLPMTYVVHDYYSICPSIYLLNEKYDYCHLPEKLSEADQGRDIRDGQSKHEPVNAACEACYRNNPFLYAGSCADMASWRKVWGMFLSCCSEIVLFSEDSRKKLEQVYGRDLRLKVMPEAHTVFSPLHREKKSTNTLNIGLLGTLTDLKGAGLIQELVTLADKKALPLQFILIGETQVKIKGACFKETRKYRPEELPSRILQEDIDLAFISSICPETYSWTAEEAMDLGLPVCALPIGAPPERVGRYEKGMVLSGYKPEQILQELLMFADRWKRLWLEQSGRILCLYEEESYAARYRIEHLCEQLRGYGIQCAHKELRDAKAADVLKADALVLYRLEDSRKLQSLMGKAKENGKKVWYSTDDLVFDMTYLKDLPFFKTREYADLPKRCLLAKQVMERCDGFLASTLTLQQVLEQAFPGKPVLLQRNRASLEMAALSEKQAVNKERMRAVKTAAPGMAGKDASAPSKQEAIRIGYLSGSHTHDEDLKQIAPAIAGTLKKHPKARLILVGALNLPEELAGFEHQIQQIRFQPWQELPALLAGLDINLMPIGDTLFHTCKSENKWMEAALVKTPTIAGRNKELEQVLTDGEEVLLAGSPEEWAERLEQLVSGGELRSAIGQKAYEKARREYLTDKLEEPVLQAFLDF
ncbi:MAG: glycosyltransferase [Firmicutes bacterium]|nr:glycosyltransferase [Bacillota bacterium]